MSSVGQGSELIDLTLICSKKTGMSFFNVSSFYLRLIRNGSDMFYDVNFPFFSLNLNGDMTTERWSPSPFHIRKTNKV